MFNNKFFKVLIATLLVCVMSTNVFAAVVSDNDASALVTKAEFEAYQANFNNKIGTYVSNMTGYIDQAIVVYLADFAGINIQEGDDDKN